MTESLPPAYDSIKELGVYDKLPSDVKNALPDLAKLPRSAQEKAQIAMAAEAAKPGTQDKMDEVKALADGAIKVDQAFERVRVGLGVVDNTDWKDKDGNPITTKFQPEWIGYQNRWTDLLWGSRDVATKTEAYINDFVNVIVPGIEKIKTNDDVADAKLDLSAFIKRTDPFGKKLNSDETKNAAIKYSQDFTDLRRDLERFRGTFDTFAEHQKVELDAAILKKKGDIVTLKVELKQCETVVMAMGIAFGVTVFATAAGAVTALAAMGPLGPFVAIGIVIFGALAAISELGVLIAYIKKTNDKRQELASAEAELVVLEAKLKALNELKAKLESQKGDITDICARIDRFAVIWGMVAHDAGLINAGLNAAVGDEGSKQAFMRRVSLVKESYTKLGAALSLYATQIDGSKGQAQ